MDEYIRTPVSTEDATSTIGEGILVGLRNGTNALGAKALYEAIVDADQAWQEAVEYMVEGMDHMGLVVCRKTYDR